MSAGEQAHQQQFDDLVLPDDDLAQLSGDPIRYVFGQLGSDGDIHAPI